MKIRQGCYSCYVPHVFRMITKQGVGEVRAKVLIEILVVGSINDNFRELLEAGPKPTVAAISGLALGGGLETAMACNARLASPGLYHTTRHCFGPQSKFSLG